MIDVGIVHGSKDMAVPVYMGYDTVYVHTDIHQDLTPDPVTGEVYPDMYVYHEVQYDYKEYFQVSNEQNLKTNSDTDAMVVDQEYRLSLIEVNMPAPMAEVDPSTKLKPGLYDTLVRMIKRNQTDGLEEKIDIFYATGAISEEEYNSLIEMLHPNTEPVEEVVK